MREIREQEQEQVWEGGGCIKPENKSKNRLGVVVSGSKTGARRDRERVVPTGPSRPENRIEYRY